jgi:hypothetical protein
MDGHGPAPDGSGRRVITIRIDASWGTPTNNSVWDATIAAIQVVYETVRVDFNLAESYISAD